MTGGGNTRRHAHRKPVIVLAGENGSDRECLRIVIEMLFPSLRGRIVDLNGTVRLRDATKPDTLRTRISKLNQLVRARAARENAAVDAVLVHEDYDDIASADRDAVRDRVNRALREEITNGTYVLATWETEAWLLLFPDALSAYCGGWAVPPRHIGRDTGRVQDPKRVLMREVSRRGPRYRESDAPRVLKIAAANGLLDKPRGSNCSWAELLTDLNRMLGRSGGHG